MAASVNDVMSALTMMEVRGVVRCTEGALYELTNKRAEIGAPQTARPGTTCIITNSGETESLIGSGDELARSRKKPNGNLVIVESAAKARTIERYLGEEFQVKASVGHVRDLQKTKMGVDVENDFEPKYSIVTDRRKVVNELKAAAKNAAGVYLATDPDREGEAISWHLSQILNIPEGRCASRRVPRNHQGCGDGGVQGSASHRLSAS